jgi:succinylarginine dihydrolase
MSDREFQFDGLVGPTHNYAGLSFGNVASMSNKGLISNPKAALLEGLEKMKFVHSLGIAQAILPPQDRPHLATLRRLGFSGSDEEIITAAAKKNEHLLRLVSSASSMWTANAATVAPSTDTEDGKLHLVPANLSTAFHRAIEPDNTTRVLRSIFADASKFVVHDALPAGVHFSDEGAANHARLVVSGRVLHLFAWGRSAFDVRIKGPKKFPARQTKEASEALARLHQISKASCLFARQHPVGIDAGAFHTDVLAVGNQNVFMCHDLAFEKSEVLLRELKKILGANLVIYRATQRELPVADAVKAYPFNSQLLSLPSGEMVIIAPTDSEENKKAHRFLTRVKESGGPVKAVYYLNVRQSMRNGGGPACLRLRVVMNEGEQSAIQSRIFYDSFLHAELALWCEKFYRDRMEKKDLQDPKLARESMNALDELTQILKLGSVYDFQREN